MECMHLYTIPYSQKAIFKYSAKVEDIMLDSEVNHMRQTDSLKGQEAGNADIEIMEMVREDKMVEMDIQLQYLKMVSVELFILWLQM